MDLENISTSIGCCENPGSIVAAFGTVMRRITDLPGEWSAFQTWKFNQWKTDCPSHQFDRNCRGRCTSASHHLFRDGRLADLDAELEQLTVDVGRTQERIGAAHLPNPMANLTIHWRRQDLTP